MTTADLLVQSGVSRRRLLADRVPSEKVESGEHLLDCTRRTVARGVSRRAADRL